MSVLALPAFSDPFYTYSISLDGADYLFRYRYNQGEQTWYLSILLPDGTPLLVGLKIVCNVDLLANRIDSRLPPGALMAISSSAQEDTPPALTELGNDDERVTLTYFTADELP